MAIATPAVFATLMPLPEATKACLDAIQRFWPNPVLKNTQTGNSVSQETLSEVCTITAYRDPETARALDADKDAYPFVMVSTGTTGSLGALILFAPDEDDQNEDITHAIFEALYE